MPTLGMDYFQQFTILCVIGLSWARTISHKDQIETTVPGEDSAISTELPLYLQEKEFKYLEDNGFLPPSLRAHDPPEILEEEVGNAIIKFQQFYKIPPSGHMDNTTRNTMWKPRCGFPDIFRFGDDNETRTTNHRRKRFNAAGGFYKWSRYKLTYAIVNHPRRGNHKSWQVRTMIKRAFEVWSEVTPLVFREAKPEEADIRIGFYSGRHSSDKDHPVFDGPDGDLAHAFSPNAGWGRVDGDVHFDNDEVFSMDASNSGGYSFFQIAAHEIGHALGLDHSEDSSALMWPHYHYMHNFRLPKDDYLGIQYLYGHVPPYTPAYTGQGIEKELEFMVCDPIWESNFLGPRGLISYNTQGPNPANKNGPSTFGVQSPCTKVFDTIVSIGGIIYILKGSRYWEVWSGRLLSEKEGKLIRDHWYRLPSRIDAVYQRKDGKTVFFKGTKYWVYYGQYPVSGYPRPVKELGLPNAIDAAVPLGSRKTFYFKKSMVWRYDERARKIDRGFPKPIREVFKGLPKRIRIAFTHDDGHTYFLKGIKYYRMTNRLKKIDAGYPREFGVDFMNCPSSQQTNKIFNLQVDDEEENSDKEEFDINEDDDSEYV